MARVQSIRSCYHWKASGQENMVPCGLLNLKDYRPTIGVITALTCRWKTQPTTNISSKTERNGHRKFALKGFCPTASGYVNLEITTSSVSDPDPDWIWIQSGQWIRIREGKKTHKNRKI